jgi:hypothetical protein
MNRSTSTPPVKQRCRYCGSRMDALSPESFRQNPFCSDCFHERLAASAATNPVTHCEVEGTYVVPVRRQPEL